MYTAVQSKKAVYCLLALHSSIHMYTPVYYVVQIQTTVTAHLKSKQLLFLTPVWQYHQGSFLSPTKLASCNCHAEAKMAKLQKRHHGEQNFILLHFFCVAMQFNKNIYEIYMYEQVFYVFPKMPP